MIEPNLTQAPPFFSSNIMRIDNGIITVENESKNPVLLKKNCQAFSVYTTKAPPKPKLNPNPIIDVKMNSLSKDEVLKGVLIDGNLPAADKQALQTTISQHLKIFQPDLPGYNHAFGPVYASMKFASKNRPVPQKLRSPHYGSHQDLLYNQKCQILKHQGVLIDPVEHGIQPILTHNSWVVKKPSAASIPWDKCTVKDTRLVVGLDPLNKFLLDPPGKVTKTDSIYSALANWSYMGELDFSDFYFQIKFRMSSDQDKQKLGYLCIR